MAKLRTLRTGAFSMSSPVTEWSDMIRQNGVILAFSVLKLIYIINIVFLCAFHHKYKGLGVCLI